ncbi:uncharacterized protein Dvir_GJ24558 [Drosophila virilis]|uniref:Uncharacterized protein n=1 Tax=Drosophila virilis TaxID=7244 RepID=B4LZB3_DROVI|nr:uncharacterized protein Dvir_GJ24558 [Drosophila virilis]
MSLQPTVASGSASGNPQLLRPQTLAGPEREPVEFNINLVGAPPEVEQLVQQIKCVAEQFLYHWKSFPIVLPQPLATSTLNVTASNATNSVSGRKKRPINQSDLFIAPPFDELDAVASDGSGEPRRLTNAQLKSLRETGLQKDKYGKPKKLTLEQLETIRKNGEFDVPSLHFTGQVHKWRLSQLLQKGTLRAHDSFLSDLALAARFVVVTARARIFSHFFSVVHAAHALLEALIRLVDMFIGVPALLAHNLDYKIKEERCRFLIAELVCRPEFEDCLDGLCSYVRKMLRRATMEKFDFNSCEVSQPVPYLFLTPKGQEIDLRLFCRDIMRKALPVLVGILERETRGWFLHFRERLIAELRAKKLTDKEIEEEVNEAVMKEYLQRVYSSIMSNAKLAELGNGVSQLLVEQAQSVVIMYKAVDKVQQDIKRTREDHQKCLANDHSVLSRVAPWLRSKLRHAEQHKLYKCAWSAHEEALKMCSQHNLHQTAYFLSRDLAFMKEREPVLLKELKNAKTPTRSFQWACRIWSPQSWIIRRNFQGQSDVIPTVISQQATSIVTPRSDPSQPVFLVEKEMIRTTSTRWPFWRLLNLLQRTWCWTWNMMFLLGILVPWCSPLGLRALFCIKPIAIQLAAHLLEKYYPSQFIGRLSISEEEFWDNKGLSVNDWPGLAGLIYTEIFSLDFLTPLTENDTHFKLEPHASLDLMRYTEMVKNANDVIGSKGLDLLGNVYAPRGNVQVHLPFLEVTAFNPRSRITLTFRKPEKRDMSVGLTTPRVRAHRAQHIPKATQDAQKPWRPWKQKCVERSVTEKLLIPLPVPHPVHIAIAIYNRDTEQPIPLDSELVWEILKSIEDCQNGEAMAVHSVARYHGAVMESSNDSLASSSSIGSTRDSGSGSVSGSNLGNGTETLPCGNREVCTQVKVDAEPAPSASGFHWTLSNWGAAQTARRRTNSNVRVDLASPEDISLDTDSSRAVFNNAYGTTV